MLSSRQAVIVILVFASVFWIVSYDLASELHQVQSAKDEAYVFSQIRFRYMQYQIAVYDNNGKEIQCSAKQLRNLTPSIASIRIYIPGHQSVKHQLINSDNLIYLFPESW